MKKLLLTLLGTLAFCYHLDTIAAPYVRYEAHTPGGKKAIDDMQKALTRLRALGCDKPVSWYYQGAIHGIPNLSKEGDLATNPLCPWYTTNAKPRTTWAKCASHNESGIPSEIHFLPWHRLYTNHFEKIVRRYSGNKNFALPYWDYIKYPTLPEKFQEKAGGSLYEPARIDSLNKGKSFSSATLASLRKDNSALASVFDYETFNNQLDKGVHGTIHDYIGGTGVTYNKIYNQYITEGLMGNVPSAGFDPVFWIHHANIDRLWQIWIDANPGKNITLAQLNSIKWSYRFAKEDGTIINYTMPQVLVASNTSDFIYDTQLPTTPSSVTPTPLIKTKAKITPLQFVEHSILSAPQHAVVSLYTAAKFSLDLSNIKLALTRPSPNDRVVLKLDTTYAGKPKGRYEVYFNLPGNIPAYSLEAQKYFGGVISFFVNDPHGKGGDASFRYDVTDELAATTQNTTTLSLTVVKTTGPQEGSVTIKNAELLHLN